MNYRHVYMLIIEHAKSEMKNGLRPKNLYQSKKYFKEQHFEIHHILPKSLYPNWRLKQLNLVALTPREHFFCHQLLVKIYPCRQMTASLWVLSNNTENKSKLSSRQYETLRINFSKSLSESRKGENNPMYNKHRVYTEEELRNIRERMCGDKNIAKQPSVRKKISDAKKGSHPKRYIHKPTGPQTKEQIEYRISRCMASEKWRASRIIITEKTKKHLEIVRKMYYEYKASGGKLSWNDWRKENHC